MINSNISLKVIDDMIENFDLYADVVVKFITMGNYIKIKIHTSNWFDAYIIFGDPSIITIHDHAENGCLYKVLRALREHVYSNVNVLNR